jgi:hypothetical protein
VKYVCVDSVEACEVVSEWVADIGEYRLCCTAQGGGACSVERVGVPETLQVIAHQQSQYGFPCNWCSVTSRIHRRHDVSLRPPPS